MTREPRFLRELALLCAPAEAPHPEADPEVRYLAAIERRLLDDPAGYVGRLTRLAQERLADEPSLDALRHLSAELMDRWRTDGVTAYACAEAMRVCLADLVLVERLGATEVPDATIATLRRELLPASLDLVGRLIRNLAERIRIRQGLGGPAQEVVRLADTLAPGAPGARTRQTRRTRRLSGPAAEEDDEPCLVVLTAGRGTRLRTTLPKGLVPVGGTPMIAQVVGAAKQAGIRRMMFVLKYRAEIQRDYLTRWGDVIVQERALGTGHSAFEALASMPAGSGPVIFSFSDEPFVTRGSFERLLERFHSTGATFVLSSFRPPAENNSGRIMRGRSGTIESVGQARLGAPDSAEADGGLYIGRRDSLVSALGEMTNDNARGEFNLPDVVAGLVAAGKTVETAPGPAGEHHGVNVPRDLALAELRAGMTNGYGMPSAAYRRAVESQVGPILELSEEGDDANSCVC